MNSLLSPRLSQGPKLSDQLFDVPMVFYLQIDLADIAQYDLERLLPDHGILAFFVLSTCMEFTDGPCQCVVRYFEHSTDLIEHKRNDPAEVTANARLVNSLVLPQLPLAAHAEWSFPIDGVVPYDDDYFDDAPDHVLTQERWDAIEYDYVFTVFIDCDDFAAGKMDQCRAQVQVW